MKREELEKEAEGWLNKWELCNKCKNKVDCISNFSYCKKVVLQSYLASAEPREKRIAELENENKTVSRKANEAIADKLIITAKYNEVLNDLNQENYNLKKENAELKENNKVYCEGNGETLVVNVSFDSFTRIKANHKMYYPAILK